MARRLSATRSRRSAGVGAENQPPRQRLETRSPAVRISDAALAVSPSSLWRQTAIFGMSWATQLLITWSSDRGSAVIWLKLSRSSRLTRHLRIAEIAACAGWRDRDRPAPLPGRRERKADTDGRWSGHPRSHRP